jgi:hypothetical protein
LKGAIAPFIEMTGSVETDFRGAAQTAANSNERKAVLSHLCLFVIHARIFWTNR